MATGGSVLVSGMGGKRTLASVELESKVEAHPLSVLPVAEPFNIEAPHAEGERLCERITSVEIVSSQIGQGPRADGIVVSVAPIDRELFHPEPAIANLDVSGLAGVPPS